jgi:DNA-binding response OmpR family regulator
MTAQRAAVVIDPAPDVRDMLREFLPEEGYAVQTTPDVATGLYLLRESATPVTVLFDVLPLPGLSHEQSGLAVLDAVAHEGDRLARHGYVLMSTTPEQVLAMVETVPPGLCILPKPFFLYELRACLEQVDERLHAQQLTPVLA